MGEPFDRIKDGSEWNAGTKRYGGVAVDGVYVHGHVRAPSIHSFPADVARHHRCFCSSSRWQRYQAKAPLYAGKCLA